MWGFRNKLIFTLVIYFAGFATAIYCLAPASEDQQDFEVKQSIAYSALKSDQFAKTFNKGMQKCIKVSKTAAVEASKIIKEQLKENAINSDS